MVAPSDNWSPEKIIVPRTVPSTYSRTAPHDLVKTFNGLRNSRMFANCGDNLGSGRFVIRVYTTLKLALFSLEWNAAIGGPKMDAAQIFSFITVAALLVMSPGPNGVLIAQTVPTKGKLAGYANVGGFIVAFFIHGALSILGISAILLASAQAFLIVKLLGAAYLCWIGVKALVEAFTHPKSIPKEIRRAERATLFSAFSQGLLTNALNPKVSMFYLAAFPQFMATGAGAVASAFVLVAIHAVLNALWFGSMVALFSRLSKATRSGSFHRWLKGVTGAVFIGFGVRLATYRAA